MSVVSFVKGKLTVLSTACDRRLGGRDFNELLVDHFRNEWLEKHKIDAYTNAKVGRLGLVLGLGLGLGLG